MYGKWLKETRVILGQGFMVEKAGKKLGIKLREKQDLVWRRNKEETQGLGCSSGLWRVTQNGIWVFSSWLEAIWSLSDLGFMQYGL